MRWDEFFFLRVAHHRQILERFKRHRNSEYEASRKLDATVVSIEQLNIVIRRQRFYVDVAIPVNDQRFQINEAAEKGEIFDQIIRQIEMCNVISQKFNDDARNFLQALKRKRNSPISYFIEDDGVTFAGSVNGRQTSYLRANYKPVDSLTRLNVQAANW